jgi:serine protease
MMRRPIKLMSLLLALWLPLWLGGALAVAGERGPLRQRPAVVGAAAEDPNEARVIVKYREGSTLMRALSVPATGAPATAVKPLHAATLSARLALPLRDGRVLGARTQGLRGQGLSSSALAARLAALPDVEWAVPDQRRRLNAVPNDPLFAASNSISPAAGQWYLRAPDSTLVSAINAVGAWEQTHGSASITVAVLDTGVRFDHPDLLRVSLGGKLYDGYDFVTDLSVANDGSARDSDASDPGDWLNQNECDPGDPAQAEPSSWHGTQTAGLIGAATDNGLGMASVGRQVMLLPVRVLGKCGGYDTDIIPAMRWAAGLSADPVINAHPARVINMSLGSSGTCDAAGKNQAYVDVFKELVGAGVTVVVAAGNDTGHAIGVPANCAGAIAVTGVRHAGTKVGYSNIGPEAAIAAPAGNCVNLSGACLYPLLTTTNSGRTTPGANTYSDSSNYSVGTSFAAPIVAGTVGLMLSVDASLSPAQVKALLQSSARAFPSSGSGAEVTACRAPDGTDQLECYCTTSTCGAGLLDAAGAITAVKALVTPPVAAIAVAPTAPIVGDAITLSAAASTASGDRTITGYQWTITAGGTIAAFSGATNAATASLVTSGAGSVTVSLAVTDSIGQSTSTSSTFIVAAAPVVVTPPSADGGGGGGAMGPGWLAGLVLAIVALWRTRPRRATRT